MSRIGDNSDDQRINEMQEAELRNRVNREKKDTEVRTTRSFQQVMQDRGKQAMAKTAAQGQGKAKEEAQAQAEQKKSPLHSLLQKNAKPGAELQRRAALSSALHSSLTKTRSADAQQAKAAETERTDDMQTKSADEKERLDKDLRETADADTKRAEEKEAEFRRIDPNDPRNDQGRVNKREQRKNRNQGQGEGEDQRRAQSIQAAEAKAASPHEPRIPPEVIEKIVNAIQSAHHADGRTEMQIELKGTLLDGVKLKVQSKDGKVHCVFSGCDRDTKNLLDASKGALMRGLAKKGLSLATLKFS